MFFENKPYQGASGRIYPIPYADGITDEKVDVTLPAEGVAAGNLHPLTCIRNEIIDVFDNNQQ